MIWPGVIFRPVGDCGKRLVRGEHGCDGGAGEEVEREGFSGIEKRGVGAPFGGVEGTEQLEEGFVEGHSVSLEECAWSVRRCIVRCDKRVQGSRVVTSVYRELTCGRESLLMILGWIWKTFLADRMLMRSIFAM